MYIDVQTPHDFAAAVSSLLPADSSAMILLAEAHQENLQDYVDALNDRGVKCFGAIFPGLIAGRRHLKTGAIVKPVNLCGDAVVVNLEHGDFDGLEKLTGRNRANSDKPMLYVYIDCLAQNVSSFLAHLFNQYGNSVNYFGGASGNRSLLSRPTVFTNDGVFQNAAVIAVVDNEAAVSVRHGWERIEGPFVATKTHNSTISEFNWEPAMDVYRRYLPEALRDTTPEDFFSKITPTYPFSIQKEGSEDVVRDPIRLTDDGEVVCISDVPENSVMYLVHGEEDNLIDAASQAIEEVTQDSGDKVDSCLVCECYSRAVLFGEHFVKELDVVGDRLSASTSDVEAEGALVMGEIASDGEQSLEFYNKTFVVSVTHA